MAFIKGWVSCKEEAGESPSVILCISIASLKLGIYVGNL